MFARAVQAGAASADDGQANSGTGQVVDLSCGRLWIWVGVVTPDAPVPPFAGKPGDCAP